MSRSASARALDVLPELREELGDGAVHFAFLDAIKAEYPAYLEHLCPMLASGGLIAADNALASDWRITDPPGSSAGRDGADKLNRRLAADPEFEAVCVPIRSGVTVACKAERQA